jgi:hypothetical protein
LLGLISVWSASAGVSSVATYTFNNSFAALESGVPDLIVTDPQAAGLFQTSIVFGTNLTTWHFDGAANPTDQQGGLTFDNTSGLIPSNNYSVEMVFQFGQNDNAWRRIIDVQNRTSDNGFYVDPSNNLNVFPVPGAGGVVTSGSFFDVFLTVDPSDNVVGYLSGVPQFTASTNLMDIDASNLMNFFLDNIAGGGTGEWSNGDVALIKIYNTALTGDEVAAATAFPSVPEPGSWSLFAAGAGLLLVMRKTRRPMSTGPSRARAYHRHPGPETPSGFSPDVRNSTRGAALVRRLTR